MNCVESRRGVENASLRSQLLTMTNDINQQKDALNDYEQYSRRECLEISGILKKIKEDTNQIVIDIGEMLGVKITEDDLSVSHRLPPNMRNLDNSIPSKNIRSHGTRGKELVIKYKSFIHIRLSVRQYLQ